MMLEVNGAGGGVNVGLPKNVNGVRTTHTCELCGFEPKTKNKYREKQDHLVMKHFKQKIDQIFPQCRPYTCPAEGCAFNGKDKQALLRHYTGKHGILDRYLKEALAEKGIQYSPGEHGSKRKNSIVTAIPGMAQQVAVAGMHTHLLTIPDGLSSVATSGSAAATTAAFTISTSSSCGGGSGGKMARLTMDQKPSAEELQKEVEAIMASLQPQPVMLATIPTSTSVSLPLPMKVQLPQHPITVVAASNDQAPLGLLSATPSGIPSALQVQPLMSALSSSASSSSVSSSSSSVISSAPHHHDLHLPIEILSNAEALVSSCIGGGPASGGAGGSVAQPLLVSSLPNVNSVQLHNDEVMWGARVTGGPAVVVETADTVPVTYIETEFGPTFATALDNFEYEVLIPGVNGSGADPLRERQIDFCMM